MAEAKAKAEAEAEAKDSRSAALQTKPPPKESESRTLRVYPELVRMIKPEKGKGGRKQMDYDAYEAEATRRVSEMTEKIDSTRIMIRKKKDRISLLRKTLRSTKDKATKK